MVFPGGTALRDRGSGTGGFDACCLWIGEEDKGDVGCGYDFWLVSNRATDEDMEKIPRIFDTRRIRSSSGKWCDDTIRSSFDCSIIIIQEQS